MLQLQHPNVVRMIGVAIQQKPWLCVLEFMYYGDLRAAVLVREKGWEEMERKVRKAAAAEVSRHGEAPSKEC